MQRTAGVSGGARRTWILRSTLEHDLVRSQRRVGEPLATEERRIAGLCACCHRVFRPESVHRLLCRGCRSHCRCSCCGQAFHGEGVSLGRVCATCWQDASDFERLNIELASHSHRVVLRELWSRVWGEQACTD